MFCKSSFLKSSVLSIALGVTLMASATVPAAAAYEPVRGNSKFERPADQWINYGPRIAGKDKLPGARTTTGNAEMPMHFPSKKKD